MANAIETLQSTILKSREAEEQRSEAVKRDYTRMLVRIALLAPGEALPPDDFERMHSLMRSLGIELSDVDRDAAAAEKYLRDRDELLQIQAEAASSPTQAELQSTLREAEKRFADEVEAMLEPLRELDAQIKTRAELDDRITSRTTSLNSLLGSHRNLAADALNN